MSDGLQSLHYRKTPDSHWYFPDGRGAGQALRLHFAPPRISIDLYGCAIRPEPAKQHLKTKILLAERGSGFYGLPEAKRL